MHPSPKNPSSRATVRRATLPAAALGLLLAACGDFGRSADADENGQTHVDLSALPNGCVVDETCGNLVGVDCGSAVDGPYYYLEKDTSRIVETCGGACMGGPKPDQDVCVECPPREWNCH